MQELIYFGIWLWIGIPVIIRFIETVNGISNMHKVREYRMRNVPVKLWSYDNGDIIKTFLILVLYVGIPFYFIFKYHLWFVNDMMTIAEIGLIVVNGLNVINFVLFIMYGKYSFLTPKFFASINADFVKEKCRFVIEQEQGENGRKFLHIYKGKKEQLFRYEIIERDEEVEYIISQYYNKQFMIK